MDPKRNEAPAYNFNSGPGPPEPPGAVPTTLEDYENKFSLSDTTALDQTWHPNTRHPLAGETDSSPHRTIQGSTSDEHDNYYHARLQHEASTRPILNNDPGDTFVMGDDPAVDDVNQQRATVTSHQTIAFDIVQALRLIAARPHPHTSLQATQPVHPFVVADTWQHDMPIIFVSNSFEAMTGYHNTEILGRNCRFLQSSDGFVQPRAPRQHIDSIDAYHFKLSLATGGEFRQTIVNFKKGGQPFINLITIIPIPWPGAESRFLFGYQIDATHNALAPKNLELNIGGRNSLFYRRTQQLCASHHRELEDATPSPSSQYQSDSSRQSEPSQASESRIIDPDDVDLNTEVLIRLFDNNSNAALDKPGYKALCKIVLDMAAGIIQVLSLTGTIVWISTSCVQLGYSPTELIGLPIQDKWHSADIPALFRHLKAAAVGQVIELISRFRRSDGEYAWLHNVGSILQMAGGRRVAVMAGLQQEVPNLNLALLDAQRGVGDQDVWVKMSRSGLILNVFPNRMTALGISQELTGTTFSQLLADDTSRERFLYLVLKSTSSRMTHQTTLELASTTGPDLLAEATIFASDTSAERRPHVLILHCRITKSTTKKGKNPEVVIAAHASSSKNEDLFEKLRSSNFGVWQVEMNSLAQENDDLRLELGRLQALSKQRKLLKRTSKVPFDGCANCHARETPEWRRGPSGQKDLCNRCGLRWAKSRHKEGTNT
ncbi:hypothetical protein PFICI_14744 [Pestalotiopsis fici W106-1]|uniref:GATA-type domain-containing protein n=1 Tax=Pestalotiopsis fici (strain W106-1 / CGMCC3.15140) TaxID=1229662 RepID=W3WIV1_PESFW|nr:uncharacterized protein PFICI_14744 [Pestalotiopsis fici W106-1]ETS73798.1 hypothetical protein PFICI_14744 [Pestalotiopsis fici W106-1]